MTGRGTGRVRDGDWAAAAGSAGALHPCRMLGGEATGRHHGGVCRENGWRDFPHFLDMFRALCGACVPTFPPWVSLWAVTGCVSLTATRPSCSRDETSPF